MKREEIIKKFITPGMKILDVGCGSGKFLLDIVKKTGCYGVGIDPFVKNLETPNYRLIKLKAEDVDRLDERFDLAYSIHSFHHLEDPVKFLKNLHRALSPQGKLVIIDWKKGTYTGIPEEYYSREELDHLLRANGFIPIESAEDSMEIYLAAKRRM